MEFESAKTEKGNVGLSFMSQEAADKQADDMDTRGNKNCFNCSHCSDCSGCSDCSDCSGCSYCSVCSGCSDCFRCSHCSGCSGCFRCSYCSGCSDCFRCSHCSHCSGCSGCSDCSGCSHCSHCSHCYNLKNAAPVAVESVEGINRDLGAPPIPVIENIHAKVLEVVSRPDALNMGNWHTCESTHCRAGWVVTLAGEAGKKLEQFHDTALAALLIYHASSEHRVSPPRFYENNETAMADIKRMAELEAQS